ncbi:MAG: DNA-binding response regulator [Flavobacteriales bacterium]|nr:MAG: DNA-binding response regulator [Flavobacteriales bacterium]
MKTIIVDDERLAREELKESLSPFKEIEIVDECGNADEALEKINELKPDLLFLDIQMPGKNGFQLLEALEKVPDVIFITAYDEYAIKAFEVSALDYVLKPIQEERLGDAVRKVIEKKKSERQSKSNGTLTEKDQVFVKDGDRCWFVELSKVRVFQSEGNYVRVYFDENKPMILKSLNNLETRLDNRIFFRANRKYIINMKWIERVENWFNGGLMAYLKGGHEIEISRRQAAKLREMMSL